MNFLLHVIVLGSISSMVVGGYNVVFGRGKIFHFGQEAFSLIAGYGIWVLVVQYGFSYLLALLCAFCMVTALSALFTWLSLRLEEDGFGVLTIAMHLIVLTIILNWQSMTRGALGIPQIPRLWLPESLEGMTAVCLVIAVLWCLFLLHIERSSFSRSLVALSEHPWHAEALGVSRSRCHFLAFFIAGMGSFLANILYPPYLYLLSPSNYDFPAMIFFVTCVLAGGPGKTVPVFFMCFVLIFLRESLRLLPIAPDLVGPLHLLLFAVILFAAVWYRRNSLFPKRRTV